MNQMQKYFLCDYYSEKLDLIFISTERAKQMKKNIAILIPLCVLLSKHGDSMTFYKKSKVK